MKKTYIIFSVIILITIIFYWYEWRTSQIRKECSWTKVVIPEQREITKEEAENNKKEYEDCQYQLEGLTGWEKLNISSKCNFDGLVERQHVPEKIYYIKATDEEYDFCIHEKGLIK